jgi:excisionase family DNA binding protein
MTDQMAGDADERRRLRVEMAAELGVPLYRRYAEPEAAALLDLTPDELQAIRQQGGIGYLQLTASKAGYFGFQLLDYLIAAIVSPLLEGPAKPPPLKPTAKPPAHGQMLLSVPEAAARLCIGRSKLYELIGEGRLQVVHIGRRTLITAESVRSLADAAKPGAT